MDDKSLHQTDPHSPSCYYCYTGVTATEARGSLSPESLSGGAATGLKSLCPLHSAGSASAPPLAFLPDGRDAQSHVTCYVDRLELITRLKVILCSNLNFLEIYRIRILSY